MAQLVTIEGSVTPCSELPRGERRTVVYSDRVKGLVRKGFVVVVSGPRDVSADNTGVTLNDPSGVTPTATGDFAPGGVVPPQFAEGSGVPNIGHELPADGQMHDISLPGIEPKTPLAQIVPQHPGEFAQHDPAAEAAQAALQDHPGAAE